MSFEEDVKFNDTEGHEFHLSRETIEFLRNLRIDDINELKDGIELLKSIRTVSHVFKWFIFGVFGIVFTITSFMSSSHEGFKFLASWFTGGAH